MNWEAGTCGKLSKGQKTMCDFALKLSTLVEAGEMTGYFCAVRRELDGETRLELFAIP